MSRGPWIWGKQLSFDSLPKSLWHQMTGAFIARFGDKVAILHLLCLSNGEKYDEWRKVEGGKAQVVVGASDPPYFRSIEKSRCYFHYWWRARGLHSCQRGGGGNPRYHVTMLRVMWLFYAWARYNQAALVLGSATPNRSMSLVPCACWKASININIPRLKITLGCQSSWNS